jgi:predicted GIY-YIG superfamily endonuclease
MDFGPRIVNLSDHLFKPDEITLLEKGLKYIPKIPVSVNDIKNLAVDYEVALQKENTNVKYVIAQDLKSFLQKDFKTKKYCPELNTLNSIKLTLKSENLIIQKADKGNAVVILNKCDYVEKCEKFFEENEIMERKSDPTAKFQLECKVTVRACVALFKWHEMNKIIQMNPSAPRFFGLPKIHKSGFPIRPVVSNVAAPNHLIARKVNSVFREQTKFTPKYGVRNTVDFIKQLSKVKIPNKCTLVSFDVCNLFTSVPPKEALEIAETILLQKSVPAPIISELCELIKMCTSQNYFLYNGKFFEQPKGLAMGSPLSPLLADIYMDHFEKDLFSSKCGLNKNILCWFRYVDDVFCAWTGSDRQLNLFLSHLNSINQNLKFTCEVEDNSAINFLDVNIRKIDDHLEFSIFRKNSFTDQIIHSNSRHCLSQKLSAFHSMLHRLMNIPMSRTNFNKELTTIKLIAKNNGYSDRLIDKLYRNKIKKIAMKDIYSSQIPEKSTAKWHRIIYLDHFSNKLNKKLPREKIKVAYYNKRNLRNLLSNVKDPIPNKDKSGVYKLRCECNAVYVGQTGRKFHERIKEHKACVKNKKMTSQFAKHLLEQNHKCDFKFEILHTENKGYKLDALEQLEILNCVNQKENIVNDFLYTFHSPLLNLPLPQPLKPPYPH